MKIEANKDIINSGQQLTYAMSGWFKSFISANHVDTGLMRDSTSTNFMTHQYGNNLRLVWSLTAVEYFRYVERWRVENGMRPMMRLVKESAEFKDNYARFIDEVKKEFTIKVIKGLTQPDKNK